MPNFIKLPIEIEAVQWTGDNFIEIDEFITIHHETYPSDGFVIIPTLEGDITASLGDWIIKGIQGEFYLCKPDIFDQTYKKPDKVSSNRKNRPLSSWKIPKSYAIICPGCGWIGTKQQLDDHRCPFCEYETVYGDLLELEMILNNTEFWNDVAIGPFALSICRALQITDMLDLVNHVKDSAENPDFTFADLRILQVQACQIFRKIKGEK